MTNRESYIKGILLQTGHIRCCTIEIKRLWEQSGHPMNIVRSVTYCPGCGWFIGLTQTPLKEAKELLRKYNLTLKTKSLT